MGHQISRKDWTDSVSEDQVTRALLDYVTKAPEGCRSFLAQNEITSYDEIFRSQCISKDAAQYWDRSTFISFLQTPFPPSLSPLLDAAHVLYKIACYHAVFPFPSEIPSLVGHDALLRAVVFLTGREQHVLGGKETLFSLAKGAQDVKRGRDETDRRRLIFRSLASLIHPYGESNKEDMKALPTEDQSLELDDLLDVLAAIQPRRAKVTPTTREDLRPVAARLSRPQPPLDDLALSRDDLYPFVKLMLILQLNGVDEDHMKCFLEWLPELDIVTKHVMSAFTPSRQGINYATFEETIHTAMPHLFHGLPWLFLTFLKTTPPPAATSSPTLPLPTRILNLPILSQLSLFLPTPRAFHAADRALFSGRTRFAHIRNLLPANAAHTTASHIADIIHKRSGSCIVLVAATSDSSEATASCIFGAYIPNPQRKVPRGSDRSDESLLFQLRPTHRVFRAGATELDYMVQEPHGPSQGGGLNFRAGSASLHLNEDLEDDLFTVGVDGGKNLGLGAGRGGHETKFRCTGTEIWALNGGTEGNL